MGAKTSTSPVPAGSRVVRLLQTPALLVRETKPRNRAGGSPAKSFLSRRHCRN
jgi:hypothetical protein